ncbi:AI-2E family transporter [Phycicoccus sp. SLBN-51]|uniref:AI-2E family transporter n=1 Tax=Phycicoccus sp. SLBN-51 TaxID=2768447 RepID=UPI001153E0C0|nr:AI-2E family transporter [Phycicoccus sp. SLBN-51]TQJ48565.1 putative PurR-regulated permease PerM [Phycicoccus sp. SLBN-51]
MTTPHETSSPHSNDVHVPRPLAVAAAWSWRLLVILAAAALLVTALRTASLIVVPLAVAALFTALLAPAALWLAARTPLSRGLSSLVVLLGAFAVVLALGTAAAAQLASGAGSMRTSAEEGFAKITEWLRTGPLQLSSAQLADYLDKARESLKANSSMLTSGALSVGTSAGHFLAGMLICLIATYFFLAEGERIWAFFVRMLPRPAQTPTHEAFRRGWTSLGHYARTQVVVAGVDAIGIGLGALILGLPFVIPLTLLVFLSSFIPIVGAILSGAVAVLIALLVKGPTVALLMLGVVLLVQQVETHVLQPFLMGRAVALHPLAVIAAVALGSFLLGIVGALFAVPVLAVANSVIRYYFRQEPELEGEPEPDPTEVTVPE